MKKDKKTEESKQEENEDSMDRWIPSNSTHPLEYELYKLQSWMHIRTERYMKKKQRLQDHFLKERYEILQKYEDKIKELDATPLPPQKKPKLTHQEMSSSRRGESDVDKGGVNSCLK
ncbi:hypothetical protein KFK09_008989 [Dendrobium nobile]|uniref:Uncharacterized protein n=1 Tax=Dendrobium nobile TaxID=94219 RepID=A0A8T3BMP1_DENNO|nr:hypothetical protein KFK09_008989 [Dendrobium nobile]